uniref:EF-hand domain-containing protein n=1 Tax=Florenciella parvula TaxID=236787 RepID=A0A7S2BS95_9STRA
MTYERFLRMIRGDLNDYREKLVRAVFDKMDNGHTGMLTQDNIAEAFRTSHHPDVRTGVRSETDVLREFTATFEDSAPDGIVTWEEFKEYYANMSASIESDAYFGVMINAAWGLEFPPPHPYHAKVATFKPIVESEALGLIRRVMQRRGLLGILELTERFEAVDRQNEARGTLNFEQFFQLNCGLQHHTARVLFNDICNVHPDNGLDEHGRTIEARAGANTEFGGSLTVWESSHSRSCISIDELLFAIGGHMMNDRRETIVKRVFDNLDQHGVGYITQQDMVRWYNAKAHPSVRAGEMLESVAHQEFISTFTRFKAHHNLTNPKISTPDRQDGKGIVTFPEFKDYYCKLNIAMGIDTTDEYFEALLLGVWGAGEFAGAEDHGGEHLGITVRRATAQDPVSALESEVKALRAKLEGLEADDAKRREVLSRTSTVAAELEIQKAHNQVGNAKVELKTKVRELIHAQERADKEGATTFRVTDERPSALGRRAVDGVHHAHVSAHEHTSQLDPAFTPHATTNSTKVNSFRKPSLGGLCCSHGTCSPNHAHEVATAATRAPFDDESSGVWNWGSSSGGGGNSAAVKPVSRPAGHVASHKAIALRHWHGSKLTHQATFADAERRNYSGSNIASGSGGGVSHTWGGTPSRYGHHGR